MIFGQLIKINIEWVNHALINDRRGEALIIILVPKKVFLHYIIISVLTDMMS